MDELEWRDIIENECRRLRLNVTFEELFGPLRSGAEPTRVILANMRGGMSLWFDGEVGSHRTLDELLRTLRHVRAMNIQRYRTVVLNRP